MYLDSLVSHIIDVIIIQSLEMEQSDILYNKNEYIETVGSSFYGSTLKLIV